jgi:hypothetical protein
MGQCLRPPIKPVQYLVDNIEKKIIENPPNQGPFRDLRFKEHRKAEDYGWLPHI